MPSVQFVLCVLYVLYGQYVQYWYLPASPWFTGARVSTLPPLSTCTRHASHVVQSCTVLYINVFSFLIAWHLWKKMFFGTLPSALSTLNKSNIACMTTCTVLFFTNSTLTMLSPEDRLPLAGTVLLFTLHCSFLLYVLLVILSHLCSYKFLL